jgi:uncharacterized oxidoreductase
MDLQQTHLLITGGSDGIGFGLAERFIRAGATVLVTGRSREKLDTAAAALPRVLTYQSDISDPVERERLAAFVGRALPGLNLLINNAGIQRRVALSVDDAPWPERQQEIDTLLSGPVHLTQLLLPLLLSPGKQSVIVNVTSGGAYVPQVFAPVYSACKAALHHFTMVLRYSLARTGCRVVELVPPAVQTALGGAKPHGASLQDFCDAVFARLTTSDADRIGYGPTANLDTVIAGQPIESLFLQSADKNPITLYQQDS